MRNLYCDVSCLRQSNAASHHVLMLAVLRVQPVRAVCLHGAPPTHAGEHALP